MKFHFPYKPYLQAAFDVLRLFCNELCLFTGLREYKSHADKGLEYFISVKRLILITNVPTAHEQSR